MAPDCGDPGLESKNSNEEEKLCIVVAPGSNIRFSGERGLDQSIGELYCVDTRLFQYRLTLNRIFLFPGESWPGKESRGQWVIVDERGKINLVESGGTPLHLSFHHGEEAARILNSSQNEVELVPISRDSAYYSQFPIDRLINKSGAADLMLTFEFPDLGPTNRIVKLFQQSQYAEQSE